MSRHNLWASPIRFAAGIALCLAVSTSTALARQAPPPTLESCRVNGINDPVLCGTYEVYEDRQRKRGRTIKLNIVVLPATAAHKRPDPFFPIAGGPGQAATDGAANDAVRFADIRRERDIVLVDLRGTGRSNRLGCDPGGVVETAEAILAGQFKSERYASCRFELERHADLRMYTTPIAVDDLDDVRRWLGYDKINLYGGSYGANAALIYLQRHPGSVRSVALRAISSLNLFDTARNSQAALDRLFEDCAHQAECSAPFPSIRRELDATLTRLATAPVKISLKDPRTGADQQMTVTREMFAGTIHRMLSDSSAQRVIPMTIDRAYNGDLSAVRDMAVRLAGIGDALSLGLNISVTCPEGIRPYERNRLASNSTKSYLGDALVRSVSKICRSWPKGELPKSYFRSVRSNVPVLIFSGLLDPSDPASEGDRVAASLPASRHIKMSGISHDFPRCGLSILAQFVTAGSTNGLDLSCVDQLHRQPFVVPK
jgi:pimeloyl-ACP methyl ester carboxylesterase